jgi:glutathione synthase/RimK-type ligase-like ATP-grasp enzyme
MKNTVLIFTSSFDKTCDYIISKYNEVSFFRFNIDLFSSYKITIGQNKFSIKNDFHEVSSDTCKSIYYRKPVPESLESIFEKRYVEFAHKEIFSVIEGLVEAFDGKCLSKPSLMRKAGNKTFQAFLASKVGFKLPDFLITNDKNQINFFVDGSVVVKPIAIGMLIDQGRKEFVQTNLYDSQKSLNLLKYTPVYFQNYIDKDFEVRATFINRKAFVVRIDSVDRVDWRKPGNSVLYSIYSLPNDVMVSCLAFLEETQMSFGCFDFIVKNDEWYFLEMNSNGQWAWLEFETGLSISETLIRFLNE